MLSRLSIQPCKTSVWNREGLNTVAAFFFFLLSIKVSEYWVWQVKNVRKGGNCSAVAVLELFQLEAGRDDTEEEYGDLDVSVDTKESPKNQWKFQVETIALAALVIFVSKKNIWYADWLILNISLYWNRETIIIKISVPLMVAGIRLRERDS